MPMFSLFIFISHLARVAVATNGGCCHRARGRWTACGRPGFVAWAQDCDENHHLRFRVLPWALNSSCDVGPIVDLELRALKLP